MDGLLTIFFFLLIVSFLVFVHELGHFTAAKLVGVPVHEFAIGFGKTLFKKHYNGTDYMIKLLPLGGYVQLEGEESMNVPGGFRSKSFLAKAFILSAGVIMNVIVAIIFFYINLTKTDFLFAIPKIIPYNFNNVEKQVEVFPLQVTGFSETSPAKDILKPGDNIIGINQTQFKTFQEFKDLLKLNESKTISVQILDLKDLGTISKDVKLGKENEDGSILGVGLYYDTKLNRPTYFLKYKANISSAFSQAWDLGIYQLRGIGSLLSNAFQTGDYSEIATSVGGPRAVGGSINEAVSAQVFDFLIPLTALISLSLAIFNILPFPALDGGQIVVAAIESLRGRQLSDEFIGKFNFIGFAFLIFLSIIITFKDLVQFKDFENLFKFMQNIFGR